MRPTRLVVLLATAVVAAAALVTWSRLRAPAESPDGAGLGRLGDYGAVPPFTLIERSGRRVTRDDLLGHVSVVDFIYTRCTETCPTQSLELARLQDEFASVPQLRLVSITIDGDHDTPAVLRDYAERYRATDRWWFLTGDPRRVYCLATQGFHLAVEPPSGAAPSCGVALRSGPAPAWAHAGPHASLMHSARLVLVDGHARIRAYHVADAGGMRIVAANLRRLLAGARS